MAAGLIRRASDFGPVDIYQFHNRQGLILQGYSWLAPAPRAIAVFIHGVTSHARFEFLNHNHQEDQENVPPPTENNTTAAYPRFLSYTGSIVEALNQNGVSFCTYDQQGHGASEAWKGCKCNVEQFDDFAFDALHFMTLVNKMYNLGPKKIPVFLAGISMGGGVCLRTLQLYKSIVSNDEVPKKLRATTELKCRDRIRRPTSPTSALLTVAACEELPLKGGIAFCPNLSLKSVQEKLSNRVLRPLAGVASTAVPKAKIASIAPNTMFPWIEADRARDNLGMYNERLPARMADENLRVGPSVMGDASLFADGVGDKPLSLLLVHSKLDTMCDPGGSATLHETLKGKVSDLSIWLLDSMWHYLIIEPGSVKLYEPVVSWITERAL